MCKRTLVSGVSAAAVLPLFVWKQRVKLLWRAVCPLKGLILLPVNTLDSFLSFQLQGLTSLSFAFVQKQQRHRLTPSYTYIYICTLLLQSLSFSLSILQVTMIS